MYKTRYLTERVLDGASSFKLRDGLRIELFLGTLQEMKWCLGTRLELIHYGWLFVLEVIPVSQGRRESCGKVDAKNIKRMINNPV